MNTRRRDFLLWVLLPAVLVPLVVALLFAVPHSFPLGEWVRALPAVHASVNGATAVGLLFARWAIKQQRSRLHKQLMYVCIGLGVLFLLSYVLYHGSVPSTKYGDTDADGLLSAAELAAAGHWRTLYLILLLSHVVLSVSVVFLVLIALHYARLKKFKRHKAVVRYAFPIWWYVSASGVCIYLMIRPFYP